MMRITLFILSFVIVTIILQFFDPLATIIYMENMSNIFCSSLCIDIWHGREKRIKKMIKRNETQLL